MRKLWWVVLGCVAFAAPVHAQSQFQTTYELGIGWTRPGLSPPSVGSVDMATAMLQGDDFLFESGLSVGVNDGLQGDNRISWLVRAALRPIVRGNTVIHVGGEFSLHSNSVLDNGESSTFLTLSGLFGVSHPVSDHLNVELHVFPLNFGFGGDDAIVRLATGQIGAHLLF